MTFPARQHVSQAGFALDALEQAVDDQRPTKAMGLVHHSDRGSQYLSIHYTERPGEAGIEPSVAAMVDRWRSSAGVCDSYDNALAETIDGLFKSRGHSRTRPMPKLQGRRIRNPRMGRLVQQPPPA